MVSNLSASSFALKSEEGKTKRGKMGGLSSLRTNLTKLAPHASLILGQVITASYIVLSKVILIEGISSSVFLVYQFMLATVFMGMLAFLFERNKRPPLKRDILCWIFLLALVGVTLAQNMLAGALYFTTSTIESSVLNMIPAITFVLSLISRQEKLEIQTWWGKGKILGTLISVSGALTLMLWRRSNDHSSMSTTFTDSMIGLLMVVIGVIAFSAWILMLEPVTRRYPSELTMTAVMFFFATLQTSVVAAILSHRASEWKLKWDLELFNIFIGGALNSGLANFFMAWCAGLKGPVFTASFSPLGLLFTTILETLFLGHSIEVGSVLGSVMIVVGLYIFLYSKTKEEAKQFPDAADDSLSSPLIP